MSKHLAKSRLSNCIADDGGSAVAEFVLLAVPLCLTLVAAMNFCTNTWVDSQLRYQAVGAARFGGLADVTPVEANEKARQDCQAISKWLQASCAVQPDALGKWSVATFSYQPLSLLLFNPGRVTVNAAVAREIAW